MCLQSNELYQWAYVYWSHVYTLMKHVEGIVLHI